MKSRRYKEKNSFYGIFNVAAKIFKIYLKTLSFRLRINKVEKDAVINTDVLVLHPLALQNKLGLKKELLSKLESKNLSVFEIDTPKIKKISQTSYLNINSDEFFLFSLYDIYSRYLIDKYNPKVLLTDDNGSLFSPFLKKHAEKKGARVVHLTHSVLTSESKKYDLIDYSYYFLYGKSSLDYLKNRTGKFGSCKVVLSGGYRYNDDRCVDYPMNKKSVLVLGMGPAMEKVPVFFENYKIISDWAICSPDYEVHVRLHPRSEGDYWDKISLLNEHVKLRPRGESFNESIASTAICITPYTNAVVDAALVGRPSILVAKPDVQDYLQVEKFYLPRAANVDDLCNRVNHITENMTVFREKASTFARYHVERGNDSCSFVADQIVKIVHGKYSEVEVVDTLKGDFL